MERIVDYLAEEEETRQARLEAVKTRKAERTNRIEAMLKDIANIRPQPVSLDFLGD